MQIFNKGGNCTFKKFSIFTLQKEDKITDLNRRVQLKMQQRTKQQQQQQQQQHQHSDTNTIVTNSDQSHRAVVNDDVVIVNNIIPKKLFNQSEEPSVGTLVTIATAPSPDYDSAVSKATSQNTVTTKAIEADGTVVAKEGLVTKEALVSRGERVVVARSNVVTMDTSPPSLRITVDGNSDSALPATSSTTTTKSSKTSGTVGEENYSESYC